MRITFTTLILSLLIAGCTEQPSPPANTHSVTSAVHVREVRNTSDNSIIWWYIIYANSMQNSCPCYVAASQSRSTDMSSLSFSRSASVPSAAGNTSNTKVEEEETEQAEVDSTEAAPTEAAPTEAAPTEAAPTEAAPTEAAPSSDSTPSGGDSGGDGGSSSD